MTMYSLEPADAQAATSAGMAECEQRQSHYMANVAGLGAHAGDAAPQEEPALQSIPATSMQSTT